MLLETVLLTPAEVAKRTKTSIPTVYRWFSPADPEAPALASLRLGACRRVSEAALADFLRQKSGAK